MEFSMLIISSCTKKKSLGNELKLQWQDLDNQNKRETILNSKKYDKIKAKDLYIGQQMKLILKGIEVIRRRCKVDHYIISAGFGLIEENFKLPAYDSSFTGLGKTEIENRSLNLGINDTLNEISLNYDLIYLALGKEYLQSIHPSLALMRNTKEVVHFSRDKLPISNSLQIYETPLLGKRNENILPYGIGSGMNAKGGLLLNFSIWIENNDFDITPGVFRKYWKNIESILMA